MAGKAPFYQKVDQQFYDQVKKENGGKLPADLTDADGNPRPLATYPTRTARTGKSGMPSRRRDRSPSGRIEGCRCALRSLRAESRRPRKIPPIKLASKGGCSVSVPMVRPENRAPKPPPEPTPRTSPAICRC